MKKPLNDLSEDLSLGEKLARLRHKQGRTIKGASRALNIKKEKIEQLENLNDEVTEKDIYLRGYLGQYAEYLGYPSEKVLEEYDKLTQEDTKKKKDSRSFLRQFKVKQSIVSSRLFIVSVTTILLLGLMGYIFWQVRALATPPSLRLSSPEQEQIIYGSDIEVSGQAERGSEVFVNNQAVLTDDSGNFNTVIPLSEGVNEVNIRVVNKLGKSNVINRTVLLRPPEQASFPVKTGDYVIGEVRAIERATMVVRADNIVIFEGLLPTGESRVFRADEELIFETDQPEVFDLRYANQAERIEDFTALDSFENENGVYQITLKTPMVDETGE